MDKQSFIILFLILGIFGCATNDRVIIEAQGELNNPILKMQVVEMSSKGIVYLVEGNAEIKKAHAAGYSDVVIDLVVECDDILWLKTGSIIGIRFDDNSYILNEPQENDTFITFELVKSQVQ